MNAASGKELKEAGMQIALFNAGSDWLEAILCKLQAFCESRKRAGEPEFKFEEFRQEAERSGLSPSSHKAWGALPRQACRRGLIVWTGKHVPAESAKTHGHYVKTWKAL